MAGQFVTAVSDAEFEKEVLQSETPVLVDFLGGVVRAVPGIGAGGG
jgi:thioredoxin-like negative regulator of GroEL